MATIKLMAHKLGQLILFAMIFFTGSIQGVRYGVLFALLLAIIAIQAVAERGLYLRISSGLIKFSVFYVVIGVFFILTGELHGNLGASAMIKAYVLYPIIWLFILNAASYERFLWDIIPIIVLGAIITSLYGILIFGVALGLLPDYFNLGVDVVSVLSTEKGSEGMDLKTIVPLLFMTPFLIALVVIRYLESANIFNIFLVIIGIISCILLSLITARRSFWVIIAIAPFLTIFFCTFKRHTGGWSRKVISMIIVLIFLLPLTWFWFGSVLSNQIDRDLNVRLFSIFEGASDSSIKHKEDQNALMLREWSDRPLLGYGHGAVVHGISSSDETPWAYEATYSLLLHNTGLVGILAYASGILWLYIQGVKIIKRSERWSGVMIAVLVGLTCFLLANVTNPYLGQVDSLWILFYPLAIINMLLLQNAKKRKNEKMNVIRRFSSDG